MTEKNPDVLTAVNGLLSEASDLLTESHAPTEEEYQVERVILGHIAQAGKTLTREQIRRRSGKAICSVPGCKRPVGREDAHYWCEEHREDWDAGAEVEAWEHARVFLDSWAAMSKEVGSPELERVTEEALGKVDENLARTRNRVERTKAALSATEEAEDA